ncbi:MAG: DUF433 domain-containing protein [bacterium]|nr:DUF433 domain-containing protein [bacterium]
MSVAATTYEHIALDDAGTPVIEGANTKVIEIVLHTRASGISPEQLHLELPHLSLGQIYSALAYYWDHKAELDADMDRRLERVEQLRRETPEPPVVERLRQLRSS